MGKSWWRSGTPSPSLYKYALAATHHIKVHPPYFPFGRIRPSKGTRLLLFNSEGLDCLRSDWRTAPTTTRSRTTYKIKIACRLFQGCHLPNMAMAYQKRVYFHFQTQLIARSRNAFPVSLIRDPAYNVCTNTIPVTASPRK